MNSEDMITNAIMISLVAQTMAHDAAYANDQDFLPIQAPLLQKSRGFLELLETRIGMQFNEFLPKNQTGWEKLPERFREMGLDQDQEILHAARELVPFGNNLIKIIEKYHPREHQANLQFGSLAGDSTTDAPPPKGVK